MALFRVDTSSFPRRYEVQTRCLMTVLLDQSGNDVALANELSETSGMEKYTFLRLTSCLYSESSTRLMSFGSPGCSLACDWATTEMSCIGYETSASVEFGECSGQLGSNSTVQYEYAPGESKLVPSWSTTTSVDIAGWTRVVVIQGGRQVLLDVSNGQSLVMVNASINDVLEAGLGGPLRLFWLGGGMSDEGAFERLDFRDMNNSSISCPSFNEVTI